MLDNSSFLSSCPKCSTEFQPARSNQKYCSDNCRKNGTRGPRTVVDSPAEKRRQETRSGRVQGLSNSFFETPPAYRAAFMVTLIKEARANKELREWLTQPHLLGVWLHHQGTGRLHIAHCLDHFCREVYGWRSFDVLKPSFALPDEAATIYPATYYGPAQTSLYEDGSLRPRPCPWAGRKQASRWKPAEAEAPPHPTVPTDSFYDALRGLREAVPLRPMATVEELAAVRHHHPRNSLA